MRSERARVYIQDHKITADEHRSTRMKILTQASPFGFLSPRPVPLLC